MLVMYEGDADFDSNLELRWDLEPPPGGIREQEFPNEFS